MVQDLSLAYAPHSVPVGTGYAVWVGIGAVLTATYAMAFNAPTSGRPRIR
jgi:quaternary ammonium compound-resistance protein SugE